jgi:hypothetical protein
MRCHGKRPLRGATNFEDTEETRALFAALAATPEPDLPHHAGLLEVSEDRECILPEQDESRHGFRLWLKLVVEHYLAPREYVLNGEVTWEGEDRDDCGTIFVKDNQVEAVEGLIINAGPSWPPQSLRRRPPEAGYSRSPRLGRQQRLPA